MSEDKNFNKLKISKTNHLFSIYCGIIYFFNKIFSKHQNILSFFRRMSRATRVHTNNNNFFSLTLARGVCKIECCATPYYIAKYSYLN